MIPEATVKSGNLRGSEGRSGGRNGRPLPDCKGPSGATVRAHTPRIPKGRALTNLLSPASHLHVGSSEEGIESGAGLASIATHRKVPRERETGRTAKGVTLRRDRFLRWVPGTPAVGAGDLFAEARTLKA
jgi:hypothetical protein